MSPSSKSSSSAGGGGGFFGLPASSPGCSLFLPVPPILFPLIRSTDALRSDNTVTSVHRPQSHSLSQSHPLVSIIAATGQSFLHFSGLQCKGRRNQEPS